MVWKHHHKENPDKPDREVLFLAIGAGLIFFCVLFVIPFLR
jgi:hypothetical protein